MEREAPTWLVTGAHGFLGANLGHFLAGRGHRVGAARTKTDSPMFDEMVAADLADPHALAREISRLRPDVVVHTAALADHARCETKPDLATLINAEAPRELAKAAAEVGARFIHISTDAVFDGAVGPYTETDEPNPFSVYGQTKLDGERGVLENPDAISRTVMRSGLDAGTAYEILSIDIADIDVGANIGARLQADRAEADTRVARANAEGRRAMAVAKEQEMIAGIEESRAQLVESEAEVPRAIADSLASGGLGIVDYYKIRNLQADTDMRRTIAGVGNGPATATHAVPSGQ